MNKDKQIELLEKQLAFWKHHSTQLAEELDKEEKIANHYAEMLDKTEEELNAERVEREWISVDERLPNPYMSVLVYMPGEAPHPTVREGFLTKHGAWYAGGFDRLPDEVVMWKEMPEAPKMKGGAE